MKCLYRYMIHGITGMCIALFFVACSTSDNGVTQKTIFLGKRNFKDTSYISLKRDTALVRVDSLVSCSLKTVNQTASCIVKVTSIFDTIFRIPARVESLYTNRLFKTKSILDSFVVSLDREKHDTILVSTDTIPELFITILNKFPYDSIIFNKKAINETLYVSTYLTAINYVDSSNGNLGAAIVDWAIGDTTYQGKGNLLPIQMPGIIKENMGSVYALEKRGADNLVRIHGPLVQGNLQYKVNIGSGIDLQDIAFFTGDKAYLIAGRDSLVHIVNSGSGSKIGTINCAAYGAFAGTDSAQVPFMKKALFVNNRLYVLCQRYVFKNGSIFPSQVPGVVVVISPYTDVVVDTIRLQHTAPVAMASFGSKLLVSCAGSWSDSTDGAIETIDCASDSITGSMAQEKLFGAPATELVVTSQIKAYAVIGNASPVLTAPEYRSVVAFNPQTGEFIHTVNGVGKPSGCIAYDGLYLYCGDAKPGTSGVIMIDPKTDVKIRKAIDFGQSNPPVSISVYTVPNARRR